MRALNEGELGMIAGGMFADGADRPIFEQINGGDLNGSYDVTDLPGVTVTPSPQDVSDANEMCVNWGQFFDGGLQRAEGTLMIIGGVVAYGKGDKNIGVASVVTGLGRFANGFNVQRNAWHGSYCIP